MSIKVTVPYGDGSRVLHEKHYKTILPQIQTYKWLNMNIINNLTGITNNNNCEGVISDYVPNMDSDSESDIDYLS